MAFDSTKSSSATGIADTKSTANEVAQGNDLKDLSRTHDDTSAASLSDGKQPSSGVSAKIKQVYEQNKKVTIGLIWILLTAYFIVSLALKKKTQTSDILPFIFLYVFITGRILFFFVPTTIVSGPVSTAWDSAVQPVVDKLSLRVRYAIGTAVLIALMLSVSLGLPTREGDSRLARMQSFLGIIVITAIMVLLSNNRRHIQWRTVIVGYLMQFCLGCIVLKTQWGSDLFQWIAGIASSFLAFANYGTSLFFTEGALTSGAIAATMFPVIIFFSAFVQMMYYLGGVQWLLKRMGWFFYKALDTSGAESIVASASPFVGQSENVLLVKDYLDHMTNSEIHACMAAGFATISGSVFQSYVAIGVNAKNLITACIMSIPCSLALSKIRYPETEEPLTKGRVVMSKREKESNVLHALGNGAATGINLSLLILATVIALVSLVNAVNFFLTWLGQFISIPDLTLELILGYIFYPFTWLLGVPGKDVLKVSKLLGLKLISNEFVAYSSLTGLGGAPAVQDTLSDERSLLIAQFALAGFANLGSVAQQIAAFGSLAPSRKADFSRLALSACLTGATATMISAAIVSMIF